MQEVVSSVDNKLRNDSKRQKQRLEKVTRDYDSILQRLSTLEAAISDPLTASTADVMRRQLQTQVQGDLQREVHKFEDNLRAQQSAQLGVLQSQWQVSSSETCYTYLPSSLC